MHDDVAELYWQIITGDKQYNDKTNDIILKVYLPDSDNSDNFRFWAHGPLYGEIEKNGKNNDSIIATVKTLEKEEDFDVRLVFDKDLITDDETLDHSNVKALDGILKVEKKRADEANARRKRWKLLDMISRVGSIVSIVFQLLSIVYIYFRFDKEYKSDFISDYNREFIDDYSVEAVDYIMNKKITPNAMSASILNLIYKKNIKAEKIELVDSDKKGLLKSEDDEYKFTFLTFDKATDDEKILIDFLFNTVGDQETFTTKQLKEYAKSTKTYNKFLGGYTKWESQVMRNAKKLNIYESHTGVSTYAVIYMIACMLIGWVLASIGLLNMYVIINILLSICILIYTFTFNKRTKYGNDHYVRWKAFKKFLVDFGTFELKELPEITLWERYLVYATVFGVAKKVSGAMNVKIKEMNIEQSNFTFTDYYLYNSLSYNISNSVSNAMSFAQATKAAQISKSTMSSGSGFGGGFSSGGGFGGGGGGGHGF